MTLENLIIAGIVGAFFLFAAAEVVFPGYKWPRQPWWVLRGLGWFVLSFVISSVVPLLTDAWLAAHAIFDLSGLGIWGIIPATLVYQLIGYGYHRALHGVKPLWRLHQTHHSSERIDIWSQFRFHPLDIAGWTVVASLASVWLLGVSVEAALATAFLNNAVAMFGHANLRTPRWLGYLVSRPENHMLHHARGANHYNYADLPLVDMIFGTFRAPATAPSKAGLWDGASRQTGRLLLGHDLSEQQTGAPDHVREEQTGS